MLFEVLKKLRHLLTRKSKIFLILLLGLSVVVAFFETLGIVAIMPFISSASHPDYVHSSDYLKFFYEFFSFSSAPDFVVFFGLSLAIFYLFRIIYNYFYTYMLSRFAYGRYHHFAYLLFSKYMNLSFEEFNKKTPVVLSKTITDEAMTLSTMLFSALVIFAESIVVLFLYILLLITNFKMTIVLSMIIIVHILLMSQTIARLIKKEELKKDELQNSFLKLLSRSFGNFKLIKLLSNEKKIIEQFDKSSGEFTRATIQNSSLAGLPKSIFENFGLIMLVGSVVYVLFKYQYAHHVIAIISMYILALYRILPAISRIIDSQNKITNSMGALENIHADVSYEVLPEGDENIVFGKEIGLRKVSIGFNGKWNILHNLDMTIRKGQKIVITGESGSGKSTLLDVIMGIHKPQSGFLYIDGSVINEKNIRSWRQKIGYVPKFTNIFGGSVASNITFGQDADEGKVFEVFNRLGLDGFFGEYNGIDTIIGDGGIRLPNIIRHKIGIARAFYNNPELVVFDDGALSSDVISIESISELFVSDTTVVAVSSDDDVLKLFERVYKIEKGKVIRA